MQPQDLPAATGHRHNRLLPRRHVKAESDFLRATVGMKNEIVDGSPFDQDVRVVRNEPMEAGSSSFAKTGFLKTVRQTSDPTSNLSKPIKKTLTVCRG
jgi:hypothetical protein